MKEKAIYGRPDQVQSHLWSKACFARCCMKALADCLILGQVDDWNRGTSTAIDPLLRSLCRISSGLSDGTRTVRPDI